MGIVTHAYGVLTRYGRGLQNTIVSEPRSVSTLSEDGFLAASNTVVTVSSPAFAFFRDMGISALSLIFACKTLKLSRKPFSRFTLFQDKCIAEALYFCLRFANLDDHAYCMFCRP